MNNTNQGLRVLSASLTWGFATAVAMWLIAYVIHLPGLTLSGWVAGSPLILAQLAGCALAARRSAFPAPLLGAGTGLVAGLVNLLILGAFLAEPAESGSKVAPDAPLVVLGYLAFSLVGGGIAGAIGGIGKTGDRQPSDLVRWRARFAGVSAAAALPVLLTGGLVTSTETGMAVPDWPTSFQANMFLLPIGQMTGDVFLEHAHRLFGSLVGLTVVVLAFWTALTERNRLVNIASLLVLSIGAIFAFFVASGPLHNIVPIVATVLAIAGAFRFGGWRFGIVTFALSLVIAQGVIGGLRVMVDSTPLAFFHGISGQLTFGYICCVAAMLHPSWSTASGTHPDGFLRTGVWVLMAMLFLQLVLGAGTRHFEQHPAFLHPHILGGVLLVVIGPLMGFRARAKHAATPALKTLGTGVVHTTGLQFVLGVITVVIVLLNKDQDKSPAHEVIFATSHQAVGALLLGLSALLFAWTLRLTPKKTAGAEESAPAA